MNGIDMIENQPPKPKRKRQQSVVAVHLTPEEKAIIGRLAFENRRSESFIVREALEQIGILPPPNRNGSTNQK